MATLTAKDKAEIASETRRLNPPNWRLYPWENGGKRGFVRLFGVADDGREYLIWRKEVRIMQDGEAWYMAVAVFLSDQPGWNGLCEIPGANEDEALTF